MRKEPMFELATRSRNRLEFPLHLIAAGTMDVSAAGDGRTPAAVRCSGNRLLPRSVQC